MTDAEYTLRARVSELEEMLRISRSYQRELDAQLVDKHVVEINVQQEYDTIVTYGGGEEEIPTYTTTTAEYNADLAKLIREQE